MPNEKLEIDIPQSKSGRIYVGLSWDDIFDKTASNTLTKNEIKGAMITALLKPKFIIAYIVFVLFFTLLGQAIYVALFSFNWSILLVLFISSNIAFGLWMRSALNKGGIHYLIDNQQKSEDLPGRDKKYGQFDIDLHCFVFNQNKEFLFEIDPTPEKMLNPGDPMSIYHSGEETDGAGVFDDETICIETNKLKEEYCYFAFAVANDCAYDFDKINNLEVRLVNSKDEKTVHQSKINSNEADGFIYCYVYKENSKWFYKTIEEYVKFDEQWQDEIIKLVQTL